MDMPRLSKSVRKITVLQRDATGSVSPVVVFQRRRRKKKSTRLVRPVERIVRSMADASNSAADSYLTRHKKSNRKRRDGWVRDGAANLTRASRKGLKELRPAAFFGL